jgi:hypothetical protein
VEYDVGGGTANGLLSIASSTMSGTASLFSIGTTTNGNIMTVRADGNIGIGTTTPAAKLHISGDGNTAFSNSSAFFTNSGTSGRRWAAGTRGDVGGANQRYFISDETASAERFRIDSAGTLSITNNGGAFANALCSGGASGLVQVGTCTSDERLKTNVVDYSTGTTTSALDAILSLHSVNFNWKDVNADPSVQNGFLAQEIAKVLPGVVTQAGTSTVTNADGTVTTITGTLGINYNALWAPTIKAIQEMNGKIFGSGQVQAISIEEITASSTISVDDKLKALGMNAKQVNDMLAATSIKYFSNIFDSYNRCSNNFNFNCDLFSRYSSWNKYERRICNKYHKYNNSNSCRRTNPDCDHKLSNHYLLNNNHNSRRPNIRWKTSSSCS